MKHFAKLIVFIFFLGCGPAQTEPADSNSGGLGLRGEPAAPSPGGGYARYPREFIKVTVRQNIAAVRACYEQQLDAHPSLSGTVKIKFIIQGNGTVQLAAVSASDLNNEAVETCIAKAVRGWRFPPTSDGKVVIVTYPFKLIPEQK
ncbi:MAG: AgmX/PglI C-terminal domain-containing protein [Deltaproteobacteria bacterium]|nr:AgmX/PglI C-terminal domain-containing protein [Deltaproteobacteria bacterium]MBN2674343.1 AgmX/PglI C-terminal domain-containing protein [Deltaproteobacteria bacterium]